jgi:hypothetical protein
MPDRREESETEEPEDAQVDRRSNSSDRRERQVDEVTRDKTTKFVRTSHFEVLNEELALLDKPGGLNILWERYCRKK